MRGIFCFILINLILINAVLASDSELHVVWDKTPIEFVVPVGSERMISFPGSVEFRNMDAHFTTDKATVMNNDGTLYIEAKKPFDPIRIAVVLKDTGDTILVDISAKANADDRPLEVIISENKIKQESAENSTDSNDNNEEDKKTPVSYITLMRYAIQHLYSPARLIKEDPRVMRSAMYTAKSVDLLYGDQVMARPLLSWQANHLFITAVLIKNKWGRTVHLDPRKIRGEWLTASFYPTNYLTGSGSLHDRTTLFLISNKPFQDALNSMQGEVHEQ